MAGIFKKFFKDGMLHGKRLLCEPEYLEYCRLLSRYERHPRYIERKIKAGAYCLDVPDLPSFLSSYKEIFLEKIYEFKSERENPFIIDLGANIGLSILYFRKLFPKAKILGYEADPYIFKFLRSNLELNNALGNLLSIENKAVWIDGGGVRFSSDHADGGRIADNVEGINIPSVDIRELLKNEVSIDFLKMDIEGAESAVIPACAGLLGNVKRIFVEYHSRRGVPQLLDKIIDVLIASGFRLHFHPVCVSSRPFVENTSSADFDLQMNIFGMKGELIEHIGFDSNATNATDGSFLLSGR